MEIRELILSRLKEIGQSQAWLAAKLGKKRGYLTDYFVKRKPKELSLDLRIKAADALALPRKLLGADVADDSPHRQAKHAGGFSENDVEPYVPPKNSYLVASPNVIYYRVKTRVLDMAMPPLLPGMLLRIDVNRSNPDALKPGQIVVAQRMGRSDLLDHKETILRQFMAPDKLVTNSSEQNDIERLDDSVRGTTTVIRGTMIGFIGEADNDTPRVSAVR